MDFLTTAYNNLMSPNPSPLYNILGALAILIIGWFVAKAIAGLVKRVLGKTSIDEKLLGNRPGLNAGAAVAKLVYYIILTFVMVLVLDKLGFGAVLDPIKAMLETFMNYVPNIVGAGIIAFIGYMAATIISELVGSAGTVLNRFSENIGLGESYSLVNILKQVVFFFIFIFALTAAFDLLAIPTISEPITNLLNSIIGAIPKILAAGIIIALFYIIGRYITAILRTFLNSANIDGMSEKMGIASMLGNNSLSSIIANLLFFFIMFFGIITGVQQLGFTELTDILGNLLDISGRILFGVIILVIGNFIASMAYNALKGTNDGAFLASIARVALLGLFLAMALSQMGIGTNIVNMAFGLILGAVAVAIALSYGLGGREAAGEHMKEILGRFRNK